MTNANKNKFFFNDNNLHLKIIIVIIPTKFLIVYIYNKAIAYLKIKFIIRWNIIKLN